MSAPANDNFANAIDLTSLSAPQAGTTVGATVESGEHNVQVYNAQSQYPNSTNTNPTVNAQASVWYKFTVNSGLFPTPPSASGYTNATPQQGVMFFETASPVGGTATTFPTYVEIFTGTTVNGLTRVATLVDYHAGRFNGQDFLSYVQFVISVGTTFYIRVSSRDGTTGTFSLNWGLVNQGQGLLDVLAGCGSGLSSDGLCYGVAQITNVVSANTVTFPTSVPAGVYEVRYLKGAFIFSASATGWTVAINGGTGQSVTIQVNWPESNAQFPQMGGFYTASGAETANQCQKVVFVTCGGSVSLAFADGFYPDNISPSNVPPPTFALVNVTNWTTLSANLTNCSFSGSAGSWSCQFGITNTSGTALPVTVTLLNTGGITGASAAQTLTLPTGNSQTGAFTFSAPISSQFCTATLQISVCGSVVATLTYPLYPIFTLSSSGGCDNGGTTYCCDANCSMIYQIATFQSIPSAAQMGVSGISFVATPSYVTTTCDTGCPTHTTQSASHGFSTGFNSDMVLLHTLPLNTPTTVNYTVAITVGSLTYPSFTASYNLLRTR